MQTPDPAGTSDPAGTWRQLAAALLALEALPAFGGAVVLVVELVRSQVVVVRNAVMLLVLAVLVGALLAAMARALLAGRRWPRSPAITWQILLLAVAYYVAAAEQVVAGIAVAVLALVTMVAVHRATVEHLES